MKQIPQWLIVGAVAVLVAFLWLKDHDRTVKDRVLYAQRDSARADSIKVLLKEAKALAARTDTLVITRLRQVAHFDTVTHTLFSRDTLTVRDTLYVKASAADSVVASCRAIITTDNRLSSTCEERIANALAQARLQNARLQDTKEQGAGFLRRRLAVTLGYGATFHDGVFTPGPSIVAGWKFWP